MRIISNFRDYYDCVQGMGQDRSLVYLRHPVTENLDRNGFPFPCAYKDPWISKGEIVAQQIIVGFCEKLYPLWHMTYAWRDEHSNKVRHKYYKICISVDEVEEHLYEYGHKDDIKDWREPSKYGHPFGRKILEKVVSRCAAEAYKYKKYFLKHRCAQFVATRSHITYHGNLNRVEFYRVIDPYTAFQEISMYWGGLAHPENKIPEIDDVTMAEAKGFDKYSFRKDPTKHKDNKRC